MSCGEIVLVKFPFSDLESSKRRPALIISQAELTPKVSLVTIAMISSQVEGLKFPGDYKIERWSDSGLLHPSLVRISKLATLEKNLVVKSLGKLSTKDIKGVKAAFQKQFKFWI